MENKPEGHYTKVDDLLLFYREGGRGDRLILLHGGGLTSKVWEQHYSFLSDKFQIYSPDCRGHGRKNNPLGTLSYSQLADDLAGFVQALRISKPFICGWSMGARRALEFAARYPQELGALVCCSGGPPLSENEAQELIKENNRALLDPEIAAGMMAKHSHVYGNTYWRSLA
ncbi:MAG: alpha/beta hydrolase [Candidatus Promineifilaceae bacterium]